MYTEENNKSREVDDLYSDLAYINILVNSTPGIESTLILDVLDKIEEKEFNSAYLIVADEKENIFQIGFSDHYSELHNFNMAEFNIDGEYSGFVLQEFFADYLDIPTFKEDEKNLSYYGVEKAIPYNFDPNELIGKCSMDRALFDKHYKIVEAELFCNKQILAVTYDGGKLGIYINSMPEVRDDEICDMAYQLGPSKKDELPEWNVILDDDYDDDEDEEYNRRELKDNYDITDIMIDSYIYNLFHKN